MTEGPTCCLLTVALCDLGSRFSKDQQERACFEFTKMFVE